MVNPLRCDAKPGGRRHPKLDLQRCGAMVHRVQHEGIAIVGAAGTALGALMSGVLNVAAAKGARNIVIHGRSGRKLLSVD